MLVTKTRSPCYEKVHFFPHIPLILLFHRCLGCLYAVTRFGIRRISAFVVKHDGTPNNLRMRTLFLVSGARMKYYAIGEWGMQRGRGMFSA